MVSNELPGPEFLTSGTPLKNLTRPSSGRRRPHSPWRRIGVRDVFRAHRALHYPVGFFASATYALHRFSSGPVRHATNRIPTARDGTNCPRLGARSWAQTHQVRPSEKIARPPRTAHRDSRQSILGASPRTGAKQTPFPCGQVAEAFLSDMILERIFLCNQEA